ncbi:unnamed protein product [Parajaminaea phylloscopi]
MFCAISGEAPQVPTLSVKSGLVYEGRLIRRYIDENGKDPITGQELKDEDLIEIKTNPRTVAPRPPTLSSIPALLSSFQNEYDAIMLEMFNMKKQYEAVRQELAHALYANDAANRVVARLMFERDQAREALVNIQSSLGTNIAPSASYAPSSSNAAAQSTASEQGGAAADDTEMRDSGASLPVEVASVVDATVQRLSTERRAKMKRKALPEGYTTSTSITSLHDSQRTLLGSARTAKKGLTNLDISPSGRFCLAASNDKNVELYNTATQTSETLKSHKKPVFSAQFAKAGTVLVGSEAESLDALPPYFVSASEDDVVKTWKLAEGDSSIYEPVHEVSDFAASVSSIAVHPSGEFFAVALRDGSFVLYRTSTAELITRVAAPTGDSEEQAAGGYSYELLRWHPDGQLLALGTAEGVVRVWDIKALALVATLRGSDIPSKPVQSIDFSENGYFMAVAVRESALAKVWDLRKLAEAASIELEGGSPVTAVKFDPSASYLAVSSGDALQLFANKTWKPLATLRADGAPAASSDQSAPDMITGIQWDPRNGELYTAGLDRSLRRWSSGESNGAAAE